MNGGGGTPGGRGGGMNGTPGGGGGGINGGGKPGRGGDVVMWSLLPKSNGGEAGVSTEDRCMSPFCSSGDWIPKKKDKRIFFALQITLTYDFVLFPH